MAEREDSGLGRRDFLVRGASAVGAGLLGATGVGALAALPEPRVRRYAPLGRTGMKIADISFGSSRTRDADVVRHAFARGVNYFDSAEGYQDGDSEKAIGEALHDVRDRIYLTSKTKAGPDATRAEMMRALRSPPDGTTPLLVTRDGRWTVSDRLTPELLDATLPPRLEQMVLARLVQLPAEIV